MRTALAIIIAALAIAAPLRAAQAPALPDPRGCDPTNAPTLPRDCDKAVEAERDPAAKSVLLYRRAYMKDATGLYENYVSAKRDLDLALSLFPDNWQALYERAFVYNEMAEWAKAKADLDREIALTPAVADGYRERALSRFQLGDLKGSYDDYAMVVTRLPNDPTARLSFARSAMWLGQFGEAAQAIAMARKQAAAMPEPRAVAGADRMKKQLNLWTHMSGPTAGASARCVWQANPNDFKKDGLIGDCTRAFLDGRNRAEKAAALTVRANALVLTLQDQQAALADFDLAAVLAPGNSRMHFNLGSALVATHHSRRAIRELDRAIAMEPTFAAYAERAAAKFALGNPKDAFEDARQSLKLQPNEVAFIVAGDVIASVENKLDTAKGYWIAAYRMGSRDEGLTVRLKGAGVAIPPPDSEWDITQEKRQ